MQIIIAQAAPVSGGIGQFIPILILCLVFGIISNLLAKQKGRNNAAWTILGLIPFVNIFAMIYFVGATNRKLEDEMSELKRRQDER